ncbi:hypothetical protein CWS02_11700 [Enterobacter sp. EA-1]|nr:hypothetical protein CWS02_11700 [Enterobacter sp. EA-1]
MFPLAECESAGRRLPDAKNWLALAEPKIASETVPRPITALEKTSAIKGNDHYYILTFTTTLARQKKRYRAAAVLSASEAATLTAGLPIVVKYNTQSPKRWRLLP